MKNSRLALSIFSGLALLLFAAPAYAASVSLAPTTVSITAGKTFTLSIAVDAGSDKVVTLKSVLSYPARVLEPVSFTLAPSWVALTQQGYDQMSGGSVIKTAGYPGGFTGEIKFGTVTFKALASGTANISSADSIAYGTGGKVALASTGGASITISPLASAPKPLATTATKKTTHKNTSVATTLQTTEKLATTTATSTASAVATSTSSSTELAAAAAAVPAASGSGSAWLWWIIGILVVACGAWLLYKKFSRQS